jgi:hypothetical protein
MADEDPLEASPPDWVFVLRESEGAAPLQILADDAARALLLQRGTGEGDAAAQTNTDELSRLLADWLSQGFSRDQIAVAAGMSIDAVERLFADPPRGSGSRGSGGDEKFQCDVVRVAKLEDVGSAEVLDTAVGDAENAE